MLVPAKRGIDSRGSPNPDRVLVLKSNEPKLISSGIGLAETSGRIPPVCCMSPVGPNVRQSHFEPKAWKRAPNPTKYYILTLCQDDLRFFVGVHLYLNFNLPYPRTMRTLSVKLKCYFSCSCQDIHRFGAGDGYLFPCIFHIKYRTAHLYTDGPLKYVQHFYSASSLSSSFYDLTPFHISTLR